ncbi:hypothetical protein CC85DRAFT_313682 [Cutaneotrichosporon oleaginosum]|uniref:Uncharacterized protein n=1 Tax=Cutaneotrichosporon oleaginosum TaxID=879819 RepID=A0A0J1AWW4_9TREE|nr:uncharacterized protein CC85DRAFT_313682 [Cutaneotrichosporon oleaginosum]KLT39789.1 hypothetical protein CC85DRAFT_313682 [Cutaneotrichosporon oleaginosum]TXT05665.1 hypothetical protein COLE_06985 [Cutaneotrichosporon oleaginosum]
MGGNAFAVPAARLTIPEYEALRLHLLFRLDAFAPVDTAPYLSNKASHGDIDVLLGWDKAGWENGKGRGEGKVNLSRVTRAEMLASALRAAGVADVTLLSPGNQLATWCDIVTAHIGGTHWLRLGGQMSVAIPMRVVREALRLWSFFVPELLDMGPPAPVTTSEDIDRDGAAPLHTSSSETFETAPTSPAGISPAPTPGFPPPTAAHLSPNHPYADLVPNTFAQVDLLLLPPPAVPFQRFTHAYGSTMLLLSQLVRRASSCRDFVLQGHCAVLRWDPYPGCPKAEVRLTHSPDALCAYLGLRWDAWEASKPATEEDLFAWFADCGAASPAARGLRQMARHGLVEGTYTHQGRSRVAVLDVFGAWLRERGWGPSTRSPSPAKSEGSEGSERTGTGTGSGKEQAAESLAEAKDGLKRATPESETEPPTPKKPKPPQPVNAVPPNQPRPLPSAHAAILRYWGKEEEYVAAVQAIRPMAALRWAGVERRRLADIRKAEEATKKEQAEAESASGCANISAAA